MGKLLKTQQSEVIQDYTQLSIKARQVSCKPFCIYWRFILKNLIEIKMQKEHVLIDNPF